MKQVYHITSENAGESIQQILSIRIGERHFGFAVTSPDVTNLYKLAWYTDAEMDEITLQNIFSRHPELQTSYKQIFICYDHPQSVLVPINHYRMDDAKLLLKSMFGICGRDAVVTEPVAGWQMHNIYSIPKEVYDWAYRHFPSSNYWHAYTISIKHIEPTDFEGSLVADFRTDNFSLVVAQGNKLLLTQTFPYSTPADVVYYLLDTCRQFSFLQESVQLSISGLVAKDSALYHELYQYFLHIRFRESEWQVPASDTEGYPAHFFTSLNDLAKCAL